jgi:xanthine dehydrogenase YagR molybdenum-binding subunit
MATGSYQTNRSEATALVRVYADGTALVRSGSADIGVGIHITLT